ncbi:hypothetical protein PR048_016300 [Dryococelus australis]|uniref:Uncharacterized protein n=1 Tax=Dryococelus australis TaxID=614101 RepID=A0ABQ9HJC4_9NEOP|nr:hypothetical protein PR048_016300 [Dryococelus australis]
MAYSKSWRRAPGGKTSCAVSTLPHLASAGQYLTHGIGNARRVLPRCGVASLLHCCLRESVHATPAGMPIKDWVSRSGARLACSFSINFSKVVLAILSRNCKLPDLKLHTTLMAVCVCVCALPSLPVGILKWVVDVIHKRKDLRSGATDRICKVSVRRSRANMLEAIHGKCSTMRLVSEFSLVFPGSPPLRSGAALYSPRFYPHRLSIRALSQDDPEMIFLGVGPSEAVLLTSSQCDKRTENLPRRRHRGANPRPSDCYHYILVWHKVEAVAPSGTLGGSTNSLNWRPRNGLCEPIATQPSGYCAALYCCAFSKLLFVTLSSVIDADVELFCNDRAHCVTTQLTLSLFGIQTASQHNTTLHIIVLSFRPVFPTQEWKKKSVYTAWQVECLSPFRRHLLREICDGENPMRVKRGMKHGRNARAEKTGDPRENPPTIGIVRHDSHLRKSESDLAGYSFEVVGRIGIHMGKVHQCSPAVTVNATGKCLVQPAGIEFGTVRFSVIEMMAVISDSRESANIWLPFPQGCWPGNSPLGKLVTRSIARRNGFWLDLISRLAVSLGREMRYMCATYLHERRRFVGNCWILSKLALVVGQREATALLGRAHYPILPSDMWRRRVSEVCVWNAARRRPPAADHAPLERRSSRLYTVRLAGPDLGES